MTPCERRLLPVIAVETAMGEMAVACPGLTVVDAARQIAREAALQMRAYQGSELTAEALYRLADEIVGAG